MVINVLPVGVESVEKRFLKLCKEAGHNFFKIEEIKGPRRNHDLVLARARLAIQLRVEGYSLKRIGQALNKDHTSIIHLIRKYGKIYDERNKSQSSNPSVC